MIKSRARIEEHSLKTNFRKSAIKSFVKTSKRSKMVPHKGPQKRTMSFKDSFKKRLISKRFMSVAFN